MLGKIQEFALCITCGKCTSVFEGSPSYVKCYACLLHRDNKVESGFKVEMNYIATGYYPLPR